MYERTYNIYTGIDTHIRTYTISSTPFIVTLGKIQPVPKHEQSVTAAATGGFVGGAAFGSLVTLLVVGIVLGAVQLKRKETARK